MSSNIENQSAYERRIRKISVSSAQAVLSKLQNASECRRPSLVLRTNSNTSLIRPVNLEARVELKLSIADEEDDELSSEKESKRKRTKKPLGLSLHLNKVTPTCSSTVIAVSSDDPKLDQCIERARQTGRLSLTLIMSKYPLKQKKKLKRIFSLREKMASNLEHRKLEVLKELGSGAFGSVHKVKDLETGIFMARKNLYWQENTSKRSDVEQRNKGILNELLILGESVSPFVVGFYDAYKTGSVLSIYIEYMDMGSLYDLMLKLNRIPEEVLASTAQSVLKAMNYLHRKFNMIHRDIKPQNILLNSNGEIKLSDFGISIELSDSSLTDSSSGSVLYMAPEIFTNQGSTTVSIHSEIWSLGLTLVHLASGTYPLPKLPSDYFAELFKVDPNGCAIRSIRNDDPKASFPFELLGDFSHELPVNLPPQYFSPHFISFVTVCLQKIPSDRKSYKRLLKHNLIKKTGDKLRLKQWISSVSGIECGVSSVC